MSSGSRPKCSAGENAVIALLAQIPPPQSGQDPWTWMAGAMALALSALFWQLVKAQEGRAADRAEDAKVCRDDLRANNDVLGEATAAMGKSHEATEKLAAGVGQLAGEVRTLGAYMDRFESRLEALERQGKEGA